MLDVLSVDRMEVVEMKASSILLVLATPIFAHLLTACGGEKRTLQMASSPYAGTWIKESAYAVFNQTRSNINGFCYQVKTQPDLHGGYSSVNATMSNSNLPTAIEVRGNGDVYNYQSQSTFADPQYRQDFKVGHVNEDGRFNNSSFAAYVDANDAKFIKADANRLLFWTGANGRWPHTSYVRIDSRDLATYSAQVSHCLNPASDGYQGGNNWSGYNQNQPPVPGTPVPNPDMTYLPPQQPTPQGQIPSQNPYDQGGYGSDYGGGADGYQFQPAPQSGFPQ